LARAIHQYSRRCNEPFIAINCASIPEQLIESELFGYEEGAFTGAKRKGMVGKLLQANGGTLFLDEIGDMPLPLQARLLRVLQEREVVPLGGRSATDFDVNLICATHRNLRELMDQRVFRDDLYYRINGISVKLPPLRERTDLVALCQKILRELSPSRPLALHGQLRQAFLHYSWPGNLRQLNNVLKTATVLVENETEITSAHLPDDFLEELASLQRQALRNGAVAPITPASMPVTQPSAIGLFVDKCDLPIPKPLPTDSTQNLEKVEIRAIMQVLDACAGNVSLASKQLNISRNTIYRKIKKLI
jgi:transcriptional regulator with PAS, ATPase and Fis domain